VWWVAGSASSADRPPSALSDAEGRFTIAEGKPGESGALVVAAEGFVPARRSVGPSDDGREIEVPLAPGARIAGRVVDRAGTPIAAVRVFCASESNRFAWPIGERWIPADPDGGSVLSGPDGRFNLTGLRSGRSYEVNAFKEGYLSLGKGLLVPAGGSADLVLDTYAEVVLQFRDSATEDPLLFAEALVSPPKGTTAAGAYVPRDALLSSRRVAPARERGVLRVRFRRDDFSAGDTAQPRIAVSAWALGYERRTEEFTLEWAKSLHRDLKLKALDSVPARPVRLRASFPSGAPLNGDLKLGLKAYDDTFVFPFPASFQTTFVDGVATDELRLRPGKYWVMLSGVDAEGMWWSEAGAPFDLSVPAGSKDEPIEASFRVSGRLVRLTVLDADGAPARGYGLGVAYDDKAGEVFATGWDVPGESGWGGERTMREQAVFLNAKACRVRVSLPDRGEATAALPLPSANQETEELTLRLSKLPVREDGPTVPSVSAPPEHRPR